MKLMELKKAVREHQGEFVCVQINKESESKRVLFRHVVSDPDPSTELPDVGQLRDFYAHFGSILFYYDAQSGDAGKYLANPGQWSELKQAFEAWIEHLEEDYIPEWVETSVVIGETPHSGNYILLATVGTEAGQVFEFDHDGYEFTQKAQTIVDYVERLIHPDSAILLDIATHMRFVEDGSHAQWWIRELIDQQGNRVRNSL